MSLLEDTKQPVLEDRHLIAANEDPTINCSALEADEF